jgi:hypothetical protein
MEKSSFLNGLRANGYEQMEMYLGICSQGIYRAVNSDGDLATLFCTQEKF